ncbi:hypothetical protein CEP52_003903 [Fusarium oligoseptatum]|uniref:Uncharacterized protein n=1 Tax=Fusarium oligoseptatum TaxID=2604345 RepID=A0A428U6A1_9HYPO|nr:hypothetical protein CEP52_003903 [Fusarium oligoseptatum]
MVSFFGLKLGGDRKKSQDKNQDDKNRFNIYIEPINQTSRPEMFIYSQPATYHSQKPPTVAPTHPPPTVIYNGIEPPT